MRPLHFGIGLGLLLGSGCALDENLGATREHAPLFAAQPRWTLTYGTADDEYGRGVAFDSAGDVLISGYVANGPTLDTIHPERNGGFLSKRAAADGAERWTTRMMGPATRVLAIATAAADDVIVAGGFEGHSDFGGQAIDAGTDAPLFLARYDRDGALQWVRDYVDDGKAHATAVAVGADGTIYVTGSVVDRATFPSDLDRAIGVGVVIAYSPTGEQLWNRRFPGVLPVGIALAGDGDLVIDATIDAPAAFGGETFTPSPLTDWPPSAQVVTRFHPSGEPVWSRLFSPTDSQEVAKGISVIDDEIVIASHVHPIAGAGGIATVRMLDGDGVELWSRRALTNLTQMEAVTTTASGAVVTGGTIATTSADFGTGMVDAWGDYVMAYDGDGTPAELRTPKDAWATFGLASHDGAVAAVGLGVDGPFPDPLPVTYAGADLRVVVLDPAPAP